MNKRYNHVVIIGLDGMGNFNKDTATPAFDEMFGNGAQTYDALSMYPTISAQNWGAMLLGVNPEVHGLTNGKCDEEEYTNKDIPSIFTTVRNAYPDSFLCACSNWNPINHGIIEHDIGVEFHTAENDADLTDIIVECISRKPDLLFIQYDDIDGAGHRYDYGTEKHLDQIRITDTYLSRIHNAYMEAGIYDDTLFIALADHGGYMRGHGGYTDGEKFVYFALAGKNIRTGTIPFARTRDINAIVRYAFGIDVPEFTTSGFTSQIPDDCFTDRANNYIISSENNSCYSGRQTPDKDSAKGLFGYISKDDTKAALFFDSNCNDSTDCYNFTEYNHVKYYSDSIFGSCTEMGSTGYAVNSELKFNNDNFSVAFWIKADKSMSNKLYVLSTKDEKAADNGFSIGFKYPASFISLANADKSGNTTFNTTCFGYEPAEWMHIIYSFDMTAKTVTVYHNFEKQREIQLPEYFTADCIPATIGNDASHSENDKLGDFVFKLDDLIILNKSMSDSEVSDLKNYYR